MRPLIISSPDFLSQANHLLSSLSHPMLTIPGTRSSAAPTEGRHPIAGLPSTPHRGRRHQLHLTHSDQVPGPRCCPFFCASDELQWQGEAVSSRLLQHPRRCHQSVPRSADERCGRVDVQITPESDSGSFQLHLCLRRRKPEGAYCDTSPASSTSRRVPGGDGDLRNLQIFQPQRLHQVCGCSAVCTLVELPHNVHNIIAT